MSDKRTGKKQKKIKPSTPAAPVLNINQPAPASKPKKTNISRKK